MHRRWWDRCKIEYKPVVYCFSKEAREWFEQNG